MREPAPTVVSFSISEPRPTTQSSPSSTRSRMQDWSPTMQPAPIVAPAKTIAPVEMTVPAPTVAGGSGSRLAVERAPSVGCFPITACSSTRTPSPSTVPGWTTAVGWTSGIEGLRQHLERANDACAVARHLRAVVLAAHELEEEGALEPERLGRGDLRDVDVAGARLPLAVRLGALPRRLLVHGHLPLELHVIEDRHLLASDDGDLAHLVRVEPREVHVRDLAAREAEVAEDDVLDAGREEVAAVGDGERGVLVEQVEDHAQVVDAERPQCVLVRAHDPEVLAVSVDAEDLAELSGSDELLQLLHAGVVEQQVARHQHPVAGRGQPDELVHLRRAHRRRLLDEDVLPRLERLLRELVVRRYGRRDDDGVEPVVGEQLVVRRRRAGVRIARREPVEPLGVEVAEDAELSELVEVADEVRAPVVEADDTDRRSRHLELPDL